MSASGKRQSKLKLVVASENIEVKPKVTSSRVLKADNLNSAGSSVRISPYVSSSVLLQTSSSHESIESLKANLKSLNDLHSKLRFMLQELEELIQD
jgi:hypothetical protein